MKVLIVGSGGREHALAWKVAQSPRVAEVLAAPGSAGMADVARCYPEVAAMDAPAIRALCEREGVSLVVVGPEDPLAAGLADRLRDAGIAVFGPSAEAAQLEASKTFSKEFMARHGIPTAEFAAFAALEPALAWVRDRGGRCVVKADGLAAGKGVAMCETPEAAEQALREAMEECRFGEAGAKVVIEEWLEGEEVSFYAITDGRNIVTLAAAQDHKRALDGDLGENTGGMGAYSPAPVCSPEVEAKILERVVRPLIDGMAAEGRPYQGVLYAGLMIDAEGDPSVVEFNVRFGDPETQPLMVRMEGDLVPLLEGSARGDLDADASLRWRDAAVCVVLASEGYPRSYPTGRRIDGLADLAGDPDVVVFHAGTSAVAGASGSFETAGGRVLGVTARGPSVASARDRAYAAVSKLHFEGAHFRRDIASRALGR